MQTRNILGISGSLRNDSSNTNILKTIRGFLPEGTQFAIYEGLAELPHFSPGLVDSASVTHFKTAIQYADAVIICTPEYAFGVPGSLKNALDWTVSTGDLNDKPVAAVSASPLNSGGSHALSSLVLTLTALGTKKNELSALSIPNVKTKIDSSGMVTDTELLQTLKQLVENLLSLITP
jgi:chromate reductase, NAD(P)H dehydrogenase (quinone)